MDLLTRLADGAPLATLPPPAVDSPRDAIDGSRVLWQRRQSRNTHAHDTAWDVADWLAAHLPADVPPWWGDPCVGVGRLALAAWERVLSTRPVDALPAWRRALMINDIDDDALDVACAAIRLATERRCVALLARGDEAPARALARAEVAAPRPRAGCAVDVLDALPRGGVVLLNPPFESVRAMHRRLGADGVARYRASSPLCVGAFDLAVPIVAAALRASAGGRLAAILPATWASAAYAAPVRDALAAAGTWVRGPESAFAAAVHTETIVGPWAPDAAPAGPRSRVAHAECFDLHGLVPLTSLVRLRGGTPGFNAAATAAQLVDAPERPPASWPFYTTASVRAWRPDHTSIRFARTRFERPWLRDDGTLPAARRALWSSPKVVVSGLDRRLRAAWDADGAALGIGLLAIPRERPPLRLLAVLNSSPAEALVRMLNPGADLTGPWRRLDVRRLGALPVPPACIEEGPEDAALRDLLCALEDDPAAQPALDAWVWRWYGDAAAGDLVRRMRATLETL